MNPYFSIKQAAEIAGLTSETLRHYDRIGLVKPCYTDSSSGYRYYSEQELIRLQTVALLKTMDLTLREIKTVLQQQDLPAIIALLKQADQKADEKIARLQSAKSRIRRACADYERKQSHTDSRQESFFVRPIPERVILVSDDMTAPTLKNLWDYHRHFYNQVGEARRSQFLFEDRAGMLQTPQYTRLFAVCLQYPSLKGLAILREGDYLCANCTEASRDEVLRKALNKVQIEYGTRPGHIIYNIVVTGILQWDYQIQLRLPSAKETS